MTDKEFYYSMYNKDLVDRAIEESKDFYKEHEADILYKMATTAEMLPDRSGASEIYDQIQHQMVSSYLHGADFAVRTELGSTGPSEETFFEFHKNVDFAVLFDFSDNDFGLAMEAGAKAYCDEFNSILRHIDMYDDHEYMKSSYIKDFNEIIKIENIKNIMKCGFASRQLSHSAEVICGRMPVIEQAMQKVQSDLDYIPWDKDMSRWEKIDDKYVETEKFPRFITGTNEEISEAIKKYGNPDENPTRTFPVWCNGEVIILYMKDGYLTYLTRQIGKVYKLVEHTEIEDDIFKFWKNADGSISFVAEFYNGGTCLSEIIEKGIREVKRNV